MVGEFSATGARTDTAEDRRATSSVDVVAIAFPASTIKETNGTSDKTLSGGQLHKYSSDISTNLHVEHKVPSFRSYLHHIVANLDKG